MDIMRYAGEMEPLLDAHKDHRRSWEDFYYVYPVISRRSKGVSIGINLNPDKVCNFDCIYCEVDRKSEPRIREVNLEILATELREMLRIWKSGELFQKPPFNLAPLEWRRLNDIAFSGDGEPTTCRHFAEAVWIASELRDELAGENTKLVLISDSTCLTRPNVIEGLRTMQKGAHEIWAKLDAGTEAYYKLVNRTSVPFSRIIENMISTSQWLPLTIQTLFLKVHGSAPSGEEVEAYCDRLKEIIDAGGQLRELQLYTVARPTPEAFATPLNRAELDAISSRVKARIDLPQVLAYGPEE